MDVATMVAITNLNMVTVMAVQAANNVITIVNGERTEEDMDGSMLKVDTKKGTQLINRNMVRNITFDNK